MLENMIKYMKKLISRPLLLGADPPSWTWASRMVSEWACYVKGKMLLSYLRIITMEKPV
jgi:hypothetical protein